MSTFDDASLVFIPSGYKTSKAYSVKPIDGTGDLTFTRSNDTATRVNSAGLIEKVRTNLVLQSETFNTTWAVNGIVVTANTAANPLTGTTTADTITADAANNFHLINQSITYAAGEASISVYVKANGYSWFVIDPTVTNVFGYFNVSTGVVGSKGSACTTSITNVGGGWYRCSVTFTATAGAATLNFSIRNANNGGTFLGDGVSGFFIYGAQAEMGVATDYIPTTTAAVSVGPVANVPRLDYLNSSCPRLLLEGQRTNIQINSENFSALAYENGTITSNNTTSPDGYVNADLYTENTTNSFHRMGPAGGQTYTNGTTYTFSVFAKANGTGRYFCVNAQSAFNARTFFDLNTGVISLIQSGSATITNYGNGWYRCTVTGTRTSGTAYDSMYFGLSTGLTDSAYTGNGTNGFWGWGVQIENSAAYATSYIPTLGAAVTRGADSSSSASIPSLFGATEGSFFIELTHDGRNPNGAIPLFLRSSVSSSFNQATYLQFGTNNIVLNVYSGTASQAAISGGSYTNGQTLKVAFAYKANDFALYVNGVQIGTDNSGAISTSLSFIDLGSYLSVQSTFQYNGKISQALLFKTRLSNSDLAALTTL